LAARRYLHEALDLARAVRSASESTVSINLALAEYCAGDVARAVELGREWMHRFRAGANQRDIGLASQNLAAYLVAQADAEEARIYAQQAMPGAMTGDYPIVSVLQIWAALGALEGRLEEAARLIGFVVAEREREDLPIQPPERRLYEELLQRLEAGLSEADLQAFRQQGALWSVAEAFEFVSTRLLPSPSTP
jgi:hypothetical protein